jgi:Trichohyalin-plectin-homology domain
LLKREQEEAAIEKLKKERQAKLLAESERSASNAGKADEIRARRAAEEYERRMRIKEKEDAAKKKAEIAELVRARKIQAEDKKARLEHQKVAQVSVVCCGVV